MEIKNLYSGENCHRGAALGALLGASVGYKDCQISPEFKEGLGSMKNGLVTLIEQMNS